MNETTQPGQRKRFLLVIIALALLAGGGGAAWQYTYGRWYETTENAYFTGNVVQVGAAINGTVVWIGPEQNDHVELGQVLLRLDDGDERALLALRKSELAAVARDVQALRAEVDRQEAESRLRAITHDLAVDEYARRKRLFPKNMVSREELDAAQTREAETRMALETAQLALKKTRLLAGSEPLAEHPRIRVASAALRTAFRNWRKTQVRSPVSGEVAQRRVQAGQHIAAGTPVFSLVQRDGGWVEANFKETQLRNMRPGQAVEMHSDLYGESMEIHGSVASIGTGTGAIFSLLPPQNATGNWIKIVQRVPVRIALQQGVDVNHPLPFGASLSVRVDTHDRSGARMAPDGSENAPVAEADIYAYQDEGVEDMILGIIDKALDQGASE